MVEHTLFYSGYGRHGWLMVSPIPPHQPLSVSMSLCNA
jgi:hypothetical protein